MKGKARRIIVSTVLVGGLAAGAVSYVIKQTQSAITASSSQATAARRSPANGSSAPSVQVSASSSGPSGSFTGPTENAYYGYVKVQAEVRNGKVKKVVVLKHPNDNGTSRYINSVAMPYLVKEAVQQQGANMRLVSGATLSSEAFVKSLRGALSQAGV